MTMNTVALSLGQTNCHQQNYHQQNRRSEDSTWNISSDIHSPSTPPSPLPSQLAATTSATSSTAAQRFSAILDKKTEITSKGRKSWSVRLGLSRQSQGSQHRRSVAGHRTGGFDSCGNAEVAGSCKNSGGRLAAERVSWGTVSGASALSQKMIYEGEPWLCGTMRSRRGQPSTVSRGFLTSTPPPQSTLPLSLALTPSSTPTPTLAPAPGTAILIVCSCPEFLNGTTRKLGNCRKCGGHRLAGFPPLRDHGFGGTCRPTTSSSRSRPSLAGVLKSPLDDPYDLVRRNRLVDRRAYRAHSISPPRQGILNNSRSHSVSRTSSDHNRESLALTMTATTSRTTPTLPLTSRDRGRIALSNQDAPDLLNSRSDWFNTVDKLKYEIEEKSQCQYDMTSNTTAWHNNTAGHNLGKISFGRRTDWILETSSCAKIDDRDLPDASSLAAAAIASIMPDSRKSILQCDVNPYKLLKKHQPHRHRQRNLTRRKYTGARDIGDTKNDAHGVGSTSDMNDQSGDYGYSDNDDETDDNDDEDNDEDCVDDDDSLSDNALQCEDHLATLFDSSKVKSIERLPTKRSAVAAIGGQRIRIFNESRERFDNNNNSDDTIDNNDNTDDDDIARHENIHVEHCFEDERSVRNSASFTRIPIPKVSPKRPPRRHKSLKNVPPRGILRKRSRTARHSESNDRNEKKIKNVLFKVNNMILAPEKLPSRTFPRCAIDTTSSGTSASATTNIIAALGSQGNVKHKSSKNRQPTKFSLLDKSRLIRIPNIKESKCLQYRKDLTNTVVNTESKSTVRRLEKETNAGVARPKNERETDAPRAEDDTELEIEIEELQNPIPRIAKDEQDLSRESEERTGRARSLKRSESERSIAKPALTAGKVLFSDTMRLKFYKRMHDRSTGETPPLGCLTTPFVRRGIAGKGEISSRASVLQELECSTGPLKKGSALRSRVKVESPRIHVTALEEVQKIKSNQPLSSQASQVPSGALELTNLHNDSLETILHTERVSADFSTNVRKSRTSMPPDIPESENICKIEISPFPPISSSPSPSLSPSQHPLIHRLQVGAHLSPTFCSRQTSSVTINREEREHQEEKDERCPRYQQQSSPDNRVTISVGGEDSLSNSTVISVNSSDHAKMTSKVQNTVPENRTLVIFDENGSNIVVEPFSNQLGATERSLEGIAETYSQRRIPTAAPREPRAERSADRLMKEATISMLLESSLKKAKENGEVLDESSGEAILKVLKETLLKSSSLESSASATDLLLNTGITFINAHDENPYEDIKEPKEPIYEEIPEILSPSQSSSLSPFASASPSSSSSSSCASSPSPSPSPSPSQSFTLPPPLPLHPPPCKTRTATTAATAYLQLTNNVYFQPEDVGNANCSSLDEHRSRRKRLHIAPPSPHIRNPESIAELFPDFKGPFNKSAASNDVVSTTSVTNKWEATFARDSPAGTPYVASPSYFFFLSEEPVPEDNSNILNFLADSKNRHSARKIGNSDPENRSNDENEYENENRKVSDDRTENDCKRDYDNVHAHSRQEHSEKQGTQEMQRRPDSLNSREDRAEKVTIELGELDEIEDGELEALYEQKETSLGDLSSKSSQISNNSDSSSEDCHLMLLNSTKELKTTTVEIERTDSGVGSESSQASSGRGALRRWRLGETPQGRPLVRSVPLLGSADAKLCQDCEQRLEAFVMDSGVAYTPFVCRKCSKKRAERKEIITEIVETEQKYGRDLQIILDEFYKPMARAGLLTQDQLSAIFLNVEELREHSLHLAKKLKDAVAVSQELDDDDLMTVDVGRIFLESERMLHAFENYCTRQAGASLLLQNLEKEKELLRIFLKVSQMENTVLRRMNLNSFLMVPVQRVTKYPLLLARLLKATPSLRTDVQEAKRKLKQAQTNMEMHLEHINAEAKDVTSTKLWRRISIIQNGRRFAGEQDMVNIKLRKIAVQVLEWAHEEARFVLEGRLLVAQPTDNNWRRGRTVKLSPVTAMLVTNGKPTNAGRFLDVNDGDSLFPTQTGIKEATLLLIKEKVGRYSLLREPLYLDKCIVCCETSFEDYFELQELFSKETLIFKAEDGARTKRWCRTLQTHAQSLGAWRRRRGALPNIMICGVTRT